MLAATAAALALHCAAVAPDAGSLPPPRSAVTMKNTTLSRELAPDQLLLVDPGAAALDYLRARNAAIQTDEGLPGLGIHLLRVRPAPGDSAPDLLAGLRAAVPDIVADLNTDLAVSGEGKAKRARTESAAEILQMIGWHTPEHGGKGIRIGVIDSAIDPSHPSLLGRDLTIRRFSDGALATDLHGTMIAAMLVGRPVGGSLPGLLPEAKIFYADIFKSVDGEDRSDARALLRAVNWMVESGVRVVNFSLVTRQPNAVLQLAVARARHNGINIVAAAGNFGPNADPVYPAGFKQVTAVTAVGLDRKLYRHANVGDYVDIAAPGVGLPTVMPELSAGTSLAVPFVVAALARLRADCRLSESAAPAVLQATARDLGGAGKDARFGWGLLQVNGDCPALAALPN